MGGGHLSRCREPGAVREVAHEQAHTELEDELLPSEEALSAPVTLGGGELEPVVGAADRGVPDEHDQPELDVAVLEVGEEQSGGEQGAGDQQAAHCRRVGLARHRLVEHLDIELRGVADLLRAQPGDHARPEAEHKQERDEPGAKRAEGELLEDHHVAKEARPRQHAFEQVEQGDEQRFTASLRAPAYGRPRARAPLRPVGRARPRVSPSPEQRRAA